MSQIHAKIAQQEYLLTCPDGQEDLLQNAAAEVDAALALARQGGLLRSREQAATWVALHTMVEVHQLRAQLASIPAVDAQALQAAHAQSEHLESLQLQQAAVAAQCDALIARLDAALHSATPEPTGHTAPEPAPLEDTPLLPSATSATT